MKTKYLLGISMLAIGSFAMTSCDDDDTYDVVGNPNNLVYINIPGEIPEGMPKNSVTYTIYHTPIGPIVDSKPEELDINAMCTKKAPTDIQVTFEVDPTMSVEGYATIPENSGIKVTLESNTLTIPAGSNRSSATVKAIIDDTNVNWALFTEPAYLIPIKIVSSSAGVPSTSLVGAAYIGISTSVKEGMVNPNANSVSGTIITDTSGWTGTWEAPAVGKNGTFDAKAFDNNRNTYPYFVANHADKVNEELINVIDLGKSYKIKGFMLRYYYNWYTIKDVKVETSSNGTEWTDQGSKAWSGNDNAFERFVSFWGPMDVRYLRLTTHSFYGGTNEGTAFSDFVAYE